MANKHIIEIEIEDGSPVQSSLESLEGFCRRVIDYKGMHDSLPVNLNYYKPGYL